MYVLPFIIIALCEYTSTAGCCGKDNREAIDLDVNTREDTDLVKVTKIGDGNMVIYKIEPQSEYKIGKFVDGQIVIYETKDNENYKFLQIKCSKANEDLFIARFKYSQGCFGTPGVNYFLFKDGWKRMTIGFYDYILYSINNGSKGSRFEHVDYYNTYLVEISKKRKSLDVSDTSQVSDLVMQQKKDDTLDIRTYKVKDDIVIYNVKTGSNEIWTRDNYICGCYEIVIYYLGQTAVMLILAVKVFEGTKLLYYKKEGQSRYSKIQKEKFDDELKELKENKNKANNNNK